MKLNLAYRLFVVGLLALTLSLVLMACADSGDDTNSQNTDEKEESNSDEAEGDNSDTEDMESVTLRLSEAQVDDYPDSIAEKQFAERVSQLSDGKITIDVYTGGQLGDEVTTIEQTQTNIIDIGRANAGPLTQFAEKFGVFSFPFLFDSREHMWTTLDNSLRKTLFDNLEEANLIGLAFYDAGARSFYTVDPIEKVEDVQGKKIRIMQNDLLIDAFNQIGTSPTPLPASEVYSALQTGVIDGGENNVSTYVADGHYEVAENFTLSEHLRIPGVLFMSKESWDSLSEAQQDIIEQASLESEDIQKEEYDNYSEEAMDKVVERGNNVIELPAKEREKFREKVSELYKDHEDQYGEIFEAVEDAR